MLTAFLLLLAVVLFLIGAFAVPEPNRGKFACIGLAALALADLLRGVGPVLH
jgi:hypothetical protein